MTGEEEEGDDELEEVVSLLSFVDDDFLRKWVLNIETLLAFSPPG